MPPAGGGTETVPQPQPSEPTEPAASEPEITHPEVPEVSEPEEEPETEKTPVVVISTPAEPEAEVTAAGVPQTSDGSFAVLWAVMVLLTGAVLAWRVLREEK